MMVRKGGIFSPSPSPFISTPPPQPKCLWWLPTSQEPGECPNTHCSHTDLLQMQIWSQQIRSRTSIALKHKCPAVVWSPSLPPHLPRPVLRPFQAFFRVPKHTKLLQPCGLGTVIPSIWNTSLSPLHSPLFFSPSHNSYSLLGNVFPNP